MSNWDNANSNPLDDLRAQYDAIMRTPMHVCTQYIAASKDSKVAHCPHCGYAILMPDGIEAYLSTDAKP